MQERNKYEDLDEVSQLKMNRLNRVIRRERELSYFRKAIRILFLFYLTSIILFLIYYMSIEKEFDYKGRVEDNCQDLETIHKVNDQIYPLVDQLANKKFFRILRVKIDNECPFWVGDFICNNKKCAICECNQNDIPQHWLAPQSDFIYQPGSDQAYWGSERDQKVLASDSWIWDVEDKLNDQGIYVDLQVNQESYTGYQGQHIWATIYNENCFKGSEWDLLCKEERALNKMISGLHSSISIQLSEYHVDLQKNRTYPSYPQFFKRVGDYPDRVKNLFFLYSVLLRALNLAQPVIDQYYITSQSFEEDIQAHSLLTDIYKVTQTQCSHPFDEKQFFSEIKEETKRSYQKYIHNISMIMDCVECEKCKLHGKMQTYGLGTALKILFSDNPQEFLGRIKRNELIAFVNTFAKVSSSVNSVALMFKRRKNYLQNLGSTLVLGIGILILFLLCAYKIYGDMGKKVERMFNRFPKMNESNGVNPRKQKKD